MAVQRIYNPGQNSFQHLRTNDGNRTNSQDCHRKTSSPLSPRINVGLKSEIQIWLGTNDHQYWFGGGGGAWFSIYRRKFGVSKFPGGMPRTPLYISREFGTRSIHPRSSSTFKILATSHNMRISCIIELFCHCIEQILQTLETCNIQKCSKEQFIKVVIIFFQISIISLALFL